MGTIIANLDGERVCLIYNTHARQVAALAPIIRAALERGSAACTSGRHTAA